MSGDRLNSLLDAEEVNRRVLAIMPGGVVHVSADGTVEHANPEAQRFLGLPYEDGHGQSTTDYELLTVREDGTPCAAEEYPVTRALVTGEPQPPTTIGVRQRDGEVRWAVFTAAPVLVDGKVIGAVVTFLDITERKRAEAARVEADARLRSVVESAASTILSTDAQGTILYINRLPTGLRSEDILGRPAWEFVEPDDAPKVKAALARCGATRHSDGYETIASDGEPYTVSVGPIVVDDAVVGFTFIASNVRRQRELEAHVMVADRMATIGTLAAGVAHEINNPLTYMLANLEWLRREQLAGAVPTARSLGHVEAALEGAQRIREVVRDLGSFSHMDRSRRVAVDVRQLLDASARMAESEIRYRARIVRDYADTPPVVVDESRLGQVFLNLIVNAAQAMPEGDAEHRVIRLVTRLAGEHLVVEVTDMGSGIPPELLHKIFDPFVTTKPPGVGTGLGLYISRNIVASMGGELTVDSTVGKGSTFRVTIPLVAAAGSGMPRTASGPPTALREAMDVSASATRVRAVPPAARRTALIVDDEPHILTVLSALLSDYHVATATSGREAMALVDQRDFDVIICDLIMPDTTGMDLFDMIRQKRPGHEERIVFMTGCAFTERAREFVDNVKNPVLEKPFHTDELRRALDLAPRADAVEDPDLPAEVVRESGPR